jgi:hypothetical protein
MSDWASARVQLLPAPEEALAAFLGAIQDDGSAPSFQLRLGAQSALRSRSQAKTWLRTTPAVVRNRLSFPKASWPRKAAPALLRGLELPPPTGIASSRSVVPMPPAP